MKNEFNINLNDIGDIKRFTEIVKNIPCRVDVEQGRYCVNGKSIMGLFALDLSKDIRVTALGFVEPMTAYTLENFNQTTFEEMSKNE